MTGKYTILGIILAFIIGISLTSVQGISPFTEIGNLEMEVLNAINDVIIELTVQTERIDSLNSTLNTMLLEVYTAGINATSRIDTNEVDISQLQSEVAILENQTAKIFKFASGAQGIPRGQGPTQMVGFDGTITKLMYSFTMITSVSPVNVTTTVRINNIDTALSCEITAVKDTLVTCSPTGSFSVNEFDLVNVREFQDVFSTIEGAGFATVFITPDS